jgi:ATP-dependent Clp protease ATP-binding subunit ClpC
MMFTRFTNRTRRSVEAAYEEARMLGHDSIGDEDLLLGILRADDGQAADVLNSLGVTLEDTREESEAMLSGALASIGISFDEVRREAGEAFDMRIPEGRRIPFSPMAKNALVGARKQMRGLGDNYLGTEHLLLGIQENEDGTAVRILARLGVAPEMLEDRLFAARSG